MFPQLLIVCCFGLFQTFLLGGTFKAAEKGKLKLISSSLEKEKRGSEIKKRRKRKNEGHENCLSF